MIGRIRTLSQINPAYAALEKEIENVLSSSTRTDLESKFVQKLTDKREIEGALTRILGTGADEDVTMALNAIWPADLVLPTIYDDAVSYSITAKLIEQVRSAATMLGFEQSGYGGFCCAPTGYVGAMAIPVAIDEYQESKIFVVFESGLLTFIDGIIRLTVAATPNDLLAGEVPEDWNKAWDRHKADTKNLDQLRQTGTDLRAWMNFIKKHDRKELAYVGLQEMRPTEVHIVASMVESAQLFVTAHEYVHAIKGHDDPMLADDYVEKEADKIGSDLVVAALSQRSDVNMYFSLAGIALAIEAICINYTPEHAHLPPAERAELMLNAVPFTDSAHLIIAKKIMNIYKNILHDLLSLTTL